MNKIQLQDFYISLVQKGLNLRFKLVDKILH